MSGHNKTMLQSSQWIGEEFPRRNEAWMIRSKITVLLDWFLDWKGIVYHELVPSCQMVNKHLYQEVLALLRDAVSRERPESWEN